MLSFQANYSSPSFDFALLIGWREREEITIIITAITAISCNKFLGLFFLRGWKEKRWREGTP